jgi:hypothetical protein
MIVHNLDLIQRAQFNDDDDDVYLDRITQHKPKIIFHM